MDKFDRIAFFGILHCLIYLILLHNEYVCLDSNVDIHFCLCVDYGSGLVKMYILVCIVWVREIILLSIIIVLLKSLLYNTEQIDAK